MRLDLFTSPDLIAFTTRDYANLAGLSVAAASKQLSRLKQKKTLVQLTRGMWANTAHPYFTPLSCVPVLLGAEQGYVSFLTALHHHGLISQIPSSIQIATTGHTRQRKTPIARFEFLQMKPEMFLHGIEWSSTAKPYLVASAEKALVDTFYITTRKSRRFAKLPELELNTPAFNLRRFQTLVRELAFSPQIASAIQRQMEFWHDHG